MNDIEVQARAIVGIGEFPTDLDRDGAWPLRLHRDRGWVYLLIDYSTYGNELLNLWGDGLMQPTWTEGMDDADALTLTRAVLEQFPPHLRMVWMTTNYGRNSPVGSVLYAEYGIEVEDA